MNGRGIDAAVALARDTARAVAEVLGSFGATVELGQAQAVERGADALDGMTVPAVVASVLFVGGASGGNVLALSVATARHLAELMGVPADATAADGDPESLSDLALSAVSEAVNQTLATAAMTTGAALGRDIGLSPPAMRVVADLADVALSDQAAHVCCVQFTVGGESGRLIQMIPETMVLRLKAALTDDEGAAAHDAPSAATALDPDRLRDASVRLEVEIGRTHMRASALMGLRDGAIVTLDRAADDPIELRVNGTPFALGRLLLEDGQWAVTIDDFHPTNRS